MPVSARDRRMLTNPWRAQDRERLWRPRVRRTARTLAVPLRAVDRLVQLKHRHVSVLEHLGHGATTRQVAAALRAGLPPAAPCCGPRAGPGHPFTCYTTAPHDEYEVVGWCSGRPWRLETTYGKPTAGAWAMIGDHRAVPRRA